MRLFILVNPRSGNGAGEALGRALKEYGEVRHIIFNRLDEQLAEGSSFDCIVVGGGDGTISAVLTSPSLPDRPVLPIALGTANDFAREMGILKALKGVPWAEIPTRINTWTTRPFATWKAEVDGTTIPFSNYCSLGFEGAVVKDFHNWRTKSSGTGRIRNRAMYSLFGVRHLSTRLRGFHLDCDSSKIAVPSSCMSLIITNLQSYLGLGLSNSISSPTDNKIECIAATSALDYVRIIGASSELIAPPKPLCSGTTITVRNIPPDTYLQIDGELKDPIQDGSVHISFMRMVSILKPG